MMPRHWPFLSGLPWQKTPKDKQTHGPISMRSSTRGLQGSLGYETTQTATLRYLRTGHACHGGLGKSELAPPAANCHTPASGVLLEGASLVGQPGFSGLLGRVLYTSVRDCQRRSSAKEHHGYLRQAISKKRKPHLRLKRGVLKNGCWWCNRSIMVWPNFIVTL